MLMGDMLMKACGSFAGRAAMLCLLLSWCRPSTCYITCFQNAAPSSCRDPRHLARSALAKRVKTLKMSENDEEKDLITKKSPETGPVLKAIWSATEVLGNVAATVTGNRSKDYQQSMPSPVSVPLSPDEALVRLREEYAKDYFLSGKIDLSLYEDDCVFADPFASFKGKERFKNNLSNLGLFIENSQAKLLALEIVAQDPLVVKSRVMVKLQLNLPWKPVLAWPWSVEHVFNERGLIARHIESWEVEPAEGVSQVFRAPPKAGWPNSK